VQEKPDETEKGTFFFLLSRPFVVDLRRFDCTSSPVFQKVERKELWIRRKYN
jgi:hypothetical protein